MDFMKNSKRAALTVFLLIALVIGIILQQRHALAMPLSANTVPYPSDQERSGSAAKPKSVRPTVVAHVRPDLMQRMRHLRPEILSAAARHNRPELSGMSTTEFAVVIATIIYNENFGWLEDDIAPLRPFTPLYQDLQRRANTQIGGSNFSVWPANLRPSVALEILRQELPLADQRTVFVPVQVAGSTIEPERFGSQDALYAAITAEISRDDLAIAYLAANLERGLYRAALEDVPINWRTLAAWHNQGIVDPRQYRANATSRDYVRRAAAYLSVARDLIERQWVMREHVEQL
jgi:hypothetical protein